MLFISNSPLYTSSIGSVQFRVFLSTCTGRRYQRRATSGLAERKVSIHAHNKSTVSSTSAAVGTCWSFLATANASAAVATVWGPYRDGRVGMVDEGRPPGGNEDPPPEPPIPGPPAHRQPSSCFVWRIGGTRGSAMLASAQHSILKPARPPCSITVATLTCLVAAAILRVKITRNMAAARHVVRQSPHANTSLPEQAHLGQTQAE